MPVVTIFESVENVQLPYEQNVTKVDGEKQMFQILEINFWSKHKL